LNTRGIYQWKKYSIGTNKKNAGKKTSAKTSTKTDVIKSGLDDLHILLQGYKQKEFKYKDKITISSGKMIVIDPYWFQTKSEIIKGKGLFTPPIINNCKSATWHPFIIGVPNLGKWGQRIMMLGLIYSGKKIDSYDPTWKKIGEVGVDSGTAGIYDLKDFPNDSNDRDGLSVQTTHTMNTVKYGATSSSGIGDGIYNVYTYKDNDGKIIGVKILFVHSFATSKLYK
jgi:hypothetical protein